MSECKDEPKKKCCCTSCRCKERIPELERILDKALGKETRRALSEWIRLKQIQGNLPI